MKEDLEKEGVIFVGSTEGLEKYPEIFRPYFGKVIPSADNKFSALNSAVFSGGSFIYVPKGVKLKQPPKPTSESMRKTLDNLKEPSLLPMKELS